jgi:predicted DNA-binding protein
MAKEYARYTKGFSYRLTEHHKKMLEALAAASKKSEANILRSISEKAIERRYKRLINKKKTQATLSL